MLEFCGHLECERCGGLECFIRFTQIECKSFSMQTLERYFSFVSHNMLLKELPRSFEQHVNKVLYKYGVVLSIFKYKFYFHLISEIKEIS